MNNLKLTGIYVRNLQNQNKELLEILKECIKEHDTIICNEFNYDTMEEKPSSYIPCKPSIIKAKQILQKYKC